MDLELDNGCVISLYQGEEKVKSVFCKNAKTNTILPEIIDSVTFIDDHAIIVVYQQLVKRYKVRNLLNETIVKKNYNKRSIFKLDPKQCKLIISLKQDGVFHDNEWVNCDTILVWYTSNLIIDVMEKNNL